jgi:hypothetical protein
MAKIGLVFIVLAMVTTHIVVDAMLDHLTEKSVNAKKPIDKKCLDLLSSTNITKIERCEFFKCFEERFPCGNKYWIMNWGYKYCRRYADPEFVAKFTESGKVLLEHVNKCLPKHLERFYKAKKLLRCKKLNQDAFDVQGKCYQDAQKLFCKAFPDNKDLFMKVLDPADVMNMDSVNMIRKTADKCQPKIDLMSLIFKSGSIPSTKS